MKNGLTVVVLLTVACATLPSNLKRATANSVGGISENEILV